MSKKRGSWCWALLWAGLVGLSLVGAGPAAAAESRPTLHLFNWADYMDPAVITAFEKQYHVKVVRNFYNSNPEMFAKLQAGGDRQYDVVFPSNYYVPRMIDAGLVQPLDHVRIPNLDNLKPKFRNPAYDPQDRYSVPYQWGDTGLAYDTRKIKNAPQSWAILFDATRNPNQPFAMRDDAQMMLGAACAYQGAGYRCTGRKHWTKAAKLLLATKQRDNFNGFAAGTPVLQQLARGTVAVGVTWNGDFYHYRRKDPKAFEHIKFIVPEEGSELWVDTMVIPKQAPHPKLAAQFINFVLRADIGAQISNRNDYATPNAAAQPELKVSLSGPPVTPTDAELQRLYFTPIIAGDDLAFVNQLWGQLLSR
ncbi:spermidine/putrescine ABC transporter substrate-binding protein [Salinisphaera sp. SPP-AMP-43]|uniref:ABC transporter substrate-binding protein n=1 Tax=Salinisphaera sp. SPP-AMP-43 TaxID=3121288 RepID=UPI003C6DF3B3